MASRPEQHSRTAGGRRLRRRQRRRRAAAAGRASAPARMLHALAAPVRLVAGLAVFRRFGGSPSGPGEPHGPGTAGDREPRNPKSGPPVDAIALPEPRG